MSTSVRVSRSRPAPPRTPHTSSLRHARGLSAPARGAVPPEIAGRDAAGDTGFAGSSTRAVHAGERRDQTGGPVATPICQTSTYWFANSADVRDYQEGRVARDEYGRYGNPTWRAAEQKLAALERAEAAVLFASGMCAATTTLLALLPRGGRLVLTKDCYRRTRQFCAEYLSKLDVRTALVDPADPQQMADALGERADVVFTELPSNPFLRVPDLGRVVALAHDRGATVIVDSTFATPVNHRPLDAGADLVVHSATKYLGGHNDLLAGVVAGRKTLVDTIRRAVGVLGGVIGPHDAFLLLRGLKTLSLRVARHNENGLAVASALARHPKIRRVFYPGLASHPDHRVASTLMSGFGGVVTFELDADFDRTVRFVDRCRLPYLAPSLGGVESLIEMPVLMSYWESPPAERAEWGISDSLVRFSCGIEDPDDLVSDLEQALEVV
jgi:cystathionine gamma-synthase